MFWKIHDIKKKLEEHLKARLDRLSPKARLVTILTMFSVFAVLALYTFCLLYTSDAADDV